MYSSRLRAFFSYFGSKHRLAERYYPPHYDVIIEPFAGSAGYSTLHHDKSVKLLDAYPVIRELWRYLIRVRESEIRGLPLLRDGESVDDLRGVCQEARWLIGFWVARGMSVPRKHLSKWGKWSIWTRERIASQLKHIRHWEVLDGGYENAPDIKGTWFIDPPYIGAGATYRMSDIDYKKLGEWCESRSGDVIVCEQEGADWLPFREFTELRGVGGAVKSTHNAEVIWTRYR